MSSSSEITLDGLERECNRILRSVNDYTSISLKSLRKQLEQDKTSIYYGQSLKDYKKTIESIVKRILTRQAKEEEEKKKKKKKKRTAAAAAAEEEEEEEEEEEVKKPWGPTYWMNEALAKVCGCIPNREEITR